VHDADGEQVKHEVRRGGERGAVREGWSAEARGRVHDFIYRVTLREELADDIAQESVVAALEGGKGAEGVDRLWPWLRRVAHYKLCDYYGRKALEKKVMSKIGEDLKGIIGEELNGPETMMQNEKNKAMREAMGALSRRHREVLVLRVFEGMSFKEIGDYLDLSVLGVRMLLYRARRSLERQLRQRGFRKTTVLGALAVFGKMTAHGEVPVTTSISAASLKVGTGAVAAAVVLSKTSLVIVGVGTVAGIVGLLYTPPVQHSAPVNEQREIVLGEERAVLPAGRGDMKVSYYYPLGWGGPVDLKVVQREGGSERWTWVRNMEGSFRMREGQAQWVNANPYQADLSRWWLPGDSAAIRRRFRGAAGRGIEVTLERIGGQVRCTGKASAFRNPQMLEKGWYQPSATGERVDERDALHQQGWTYFTIEGEIRGEMVRGEGRLPFLWGALGRHWPWVRLEVGGREMVGVSRPVADRAGTVVRLRDEGGGFIGLMRPWEGRHTIDVVRGDAAKEGYTVESCRWLDGERVELGLQSQSKALRYTINMEEDLIETIELSDSAGQLAFHYSGESKGPRKYGTGPDAESIKGSLIPKGIFSLMGF